MATLQSRDKFIEKSAKRHNSFYDYSLVDYKTCHDVVRIICPAHGEFSIIAYKHTAGGKCPSCATQCRIDGKALTQEIFLKRSKEVHGDRYDYSKAIFKRTRDSVKIICKIHGEFEQIASDHFIGRGCKSCGRSRQIAKRRSTTEEFIKKAAIIHGDKYDYSLVDYVNNSIKVCIGCKTHGQFLQSPAGHLRGNGCLFCVSTGYKLDKPGFLYLLSSGDITKIGITNKNPPRRISEISSSYKERFELVSSWYFEDGRKALELEKIFLKYLKNNYLQPDSYFDGYTECFYFVDRDTLLAKINNEVSKREHKW